MPDKPLSHWPSVGFVYKLHIPVVNIWLCVYFFPVSASLLQFSLRQVSTVTAVPWGAGPRHSQMLLLLQTLQLLWNMFFALTYPYTLQHLLGGQTYTARAIWPKLSGTSFTRSQPRRSRDSSISQGSAFKGHYKTWMSGQPLLHAFLLVQ